MSVLQLDVHKNGKCSRVLLLRWAWLEMLGWFEKVPEILSRILVVKSKSESNVWRMQESPDKLMSQLVSRLYLDSKVILSSQYLYLYP